MKVLVKYNSNWHTGENITGFIVMDNNNYFKTIDHMKKVFEYSKTQEGVVQFTFGYEVNNCFETFENFFKDFEIKEITESELEVIKKMFPDCETQCYGYLPLDFGVLDAA